MRIINSADRDPSKFTDFESDMIYNGLDCCVTREIFDAIHPQLDPTTAATYDFSRAMQGPVLDMRLSGLLVDKARVNQVIDEFYDKLDALERQLDRLVLDGFGLVTFKWSSPNDLKKLFYETIGIPPIRSKGRVSTDVVALEKSRS